MRERTKEREGERGLNKETEENGTVPLSLTSGSLVPNGQGRQKTDQKSGRVA